VSRSIILYRIPLLVLGLLVLGPVGLPGRAGEPRILEIHPAVRLVVNDRGDLLFEVKAAPGDGWSHLAERFTRSRSDWPALKALNGGGEPAHNRYYRVPYALLRDEYRFLGIAALFPDDVVGVSGWRHRVGTARLPIEEESLYRLAFWFTGDGENFRALLAVNDMQDPSLHPGQEILIPPELLDAAFHAVARPGEVPLIYDQDEQGAYAGYRLRRGEALYSAVVIRLTGRVHPEDVDEAVRRIAKRSGIRDVKDIPAGFLIKIALDDLAEEFLPPNDPRRVSLEMNRLLASRYQTTVRSRDLAGITVILDPGHGGIDVGTRQHGVWEDDTVYDIAVRLRHKLVETTAAKVVMTLRDRSQKDSPHDGKFTAIDRDEIILTHPPHLSTDSASRAVGVNLRAFLANSVYRQQRRQGTDDERIVFISIHADALHRTVRGAMVYVPGERFRRGRYGASGRTYRKYSEVREQPYISFTRAERLRSEGLSRQFARSLLDAFEDQDLAIHPDRPIRDHIVRNRRSWVPAVLRGNEVPIKVLLEVANIGNREDAKLLAAPQHRDRIADAIFEALLSFYRGRNGPAVS
jgi:N-acetylmuramoyl-L-alanine amidase